MQDILESRENENLLRLKQCRSAVHLESSCTSIRGCSLRTVCKSGWCLLCPTTRVVFMCHITVLDAPQFCKMGSAHNALLAYVFHNNWRMISEDVGRHEQGYAPQWQRTFYALLDRFVAPGKAGNGVVGLGTGELGDMMDEALRYLASLMSNSLHSLLKNSQLCTLKDKYPAG